MGDAAGEIPAPVSTARLASAADKVRALLRAALDIALPRLCAVCREPVEGEGLCAPCWSKLSFITRPYCERLGIPFVYDPGPASCPWKPSLIRRPTIAPAPPCASTRFRALWCM